MNKPITMVINKPITMVIKETKNKIANICNESGLSPVVLDLIVQGIYSEIHSLAERQALEEEMAYVTAINEASKKVEITDENTK